MVLGKEVKVDPYQTPYSTIPFNRKEQLSWVFIRNTETRMEGQPVHGS